MGPGTSWCASFVNWCMNQAGYINTYSYPALAYGWKPNAWAEGEIHGIDRDPKGVPFLGAIVVFNFSHVAFVVGQTNDGRIVALGGNQGNYYMNITSVGSGAVLYYMKPRGYIVSSESEKLPVLNVAGGEMTYENTHN
ncbi:CHAP domain-containing protein [Limnobaculum parvum]|uniref:CHAP domain-containing protein n=2 Tax=Limnobaculum parvum TaxID=2172103 RepID=A0A2Y9U0T5_9GAMM|nr:CHAP domain-containing protein [Limnobaculum parvum]